MTPRTMGRTSTGPPIASVNGGVGTVVLSGVCKLLVEDVVVVVLEYGSGDSFESVRISKVDRVVQEPLMQ